MLHYRLLMSLWLSGMVLGLAGCTATTPEIPVVAESRSQPAVAPPVTPVVAPPVAPVVPPRPAVSAGLPPVVPGVAVASLGPGASGAQRRLALVVGNEQYNKGPLSNAVNDATDLATTLQRVGFTVTPLFNATRRQMQEAIDALRRDLRPEDVGLFYFAGHGMQVKGENYLIPVDARLESEADVPYDTVPAGLVVDKMAEAGNTLNLVILDACRNNPYTRQWRSAGQQGLASMQASIRGDKEMLIAYSTAPGDLAADGRDGNSPYTKHLVEHLQTPGLPVEEVFKRVRAAVVQETAGKQRPWESVSLTGDFRFVDAAASALPVSDSTEQRRLAEQVQRLNAQVQQLSAQIQRPLGEQAEGARTPEIVPKRPPLPALPSSEDGGPPGLEPTGPTPPLETPGTHQKVAALVAPPVAPPVAFPMWRNSLDMEFVLLPEGDVQMGTHDGKPGQTVRLSRPFYLGKYEVTQAQWQAVMGTNPSRFTGHPQRPVERVSWDDVQEFLRRLNAREGGTSYRLPTEAEWDYAAEAGILTSYSFGDDAAALEQYAWYGANASQRAHPVGQKLPNAWGLHDMHGNVWEWVSQGTTAAAADPAGPDVGSHQVFLGGSWGTSAEYCQVGSRVTADPGYHDGDLGFRLLRVAP